MNNWNITLILKNGKEIHGIFSTDHKDSADVYRQILGDMNETANEVKWMTISTGTNQVTSVKFREVVAIILNA